MTSSNRKSARALWLGLMVARAAKGVARKRPAVEKYVRGEAGVKAS